jgi:hypothetical protein
MDIPALCCVNCVLLSIPLWPLEASGICMEDSLECGSNPAFRRALSCRLRSDSLLFLLDLASFSDSVESNFL